jgi:2-isopropylmalate synthase
MKIIQVLDTTLREGEQTPGVNFSNEQRISFAKLASEFGVDQLELPNPSINSKTESFVREIAFEKLDCELLCHVRAVESEIDAVADLNIGRVAIFFGSSKSHLEHKLRISEENAVQRVVEVIEYAVSRGLKVRYTAEDASRTETGFLKKICSKAVSAGADTISIADTVGVMTPFVYYRLVKDIKEAVPRCSIDVHCHNDLGLSSANALAGIRAGATRVHCTANGLGERAGITDLVSFSAVLHYFNLNTRLKLGLVSELSAFVENAAGVAVHSLAPVSGKNAFTHRSGVHSDGVIKNPSTYEFLPPEVFGRKRKILVDRLAGKRAVEKSLKDKGIVLSREKISLLLNEIKESDTNEVDAEMILRRGSESDGVCDGYPC